MAHICKSLQELEKALQEKVDIALLTDVAETVRDVMLAHIIEDVYDVYSPSTYVRRNNENGLMDGNNINASIKGNTLIVENNTLGRPYYRDGKELKRSQNADKEIAGVIETGQGYDVHDWEYDGIPRPFIENTRKELFDYEWHKKALKQGLQKQGLEVK